MDDREPSEGILLLQGWMDVNRSQLRRTVQSVVVLVLVLAIGLCALSNGASSLNLSQDSLNQNNSSQNGTSQAQQSAAVTLDMDSTSRTRVVLQSVTLPENGYVVVHGSGYNASSPTAASIIGRSEYVQNGSYDNVYIELFEVPNQTFNRSRINDTERIYVTLHDETNGNGLFEYVHPASPDRPFRNKSGRPIVETNHIGTVDTAEQNGTAATTADNDTVSQFQDKPQNSTTEVSDNGKNGRRSYRTIFGLTLVIGVLIGGLGYGFIVRRKRREISSMVENEHTNVSVLEQAVGRFRMTLNPHTIDIRAYGLPPNCDTIKINITPDDSDKQKKALREFASVQELQVASETESTKNSSTTDGFPHQEGTLQLSYETLESVLSTAQEGDEHAQTVVAALKQILGAYAPEAVTAVSDQAADTDHEM